MSQDFTLFKQRLEESGMKKEQIENILEIAHNSIYPKKYGLVWEEKEEKIKEDLKLNLPYLEEVKEREIKLGKENSPQHLLIEGDNYETLKLLQTTHRGKVNVIYIDPPYNTGKEFVYNDKLVDKEDGYRHSKWLSFMHKRLLLAKELMSEDGVIFISIDDNEMAQLKLLCDEVFGETNFIANLIWKKKQGGGNDSKHFICEHEYLLVYSKNKFYFKTNLDEDYEVKGSYPFKDENGAYNLITLDKSSLGYIKSLDFPIYDPEGNEYNPRTIKGKKSRWRWGKDKVEKDYNQLVFKDGKVYTKNYKPDGVTPKSLLIDDRYGRTNTGKLELNDIFGCDLFSYPKNTKLLDHLLKVSSSKNAVILDFFAGSGTTGHSVLKLNKEDCGNRQFILCTNNENNICQEVTYERLKRVINGYETPKGKEVEGILANLKYLKVKMIEKESNTEEDLSYLYMPHVLPLLQLKHNAFSVIAQTEEAIIYEKEGFRFGVAGDLAVESDFELLSQHLKEFEGEKILYLFSTDTQSYPKYQQLAELDGIIQPIPREILNLLKGE